uniref:G-protein coupled receptors family 1 profile domain-containing protein n=1 Tax=Plectus sambesii TaxID=2011161 RepID=A0A914USV3_9BILA
MYWLAMSSTVFNPFIYCWLNARFRTGFKYVFRWLPCVHMTKYEYLHSQLFDCPQRGSRGTTLTSHGAMTNGRGSGRRSIPRHAFDNNNHIRTERTLSAAAVEHPLVNAVSFDDDSSRM